MSITSVADVAKRAPDSVTISVLTGSLVLTIGGERVPLNSGLQQHLLTELIVADGASVPRTDLIERLWPNQRPSDADNLLSTHVGRLRRLLDGDRAQPGSAIPRSTRGYRLDPDRVRLDSAELEFALDRLRAGPHTVADQDHAYALLESLRLPTGRDDRLQPLLEESWRRARRICALLVEAQPDARGWARLESYLAAAHERAPFDEQVAAWWLTSIARTGRIGEALSSYPRLIASLRDELGSQPGPELTAVHARLLELAAGPEQQPVEPDPGEPVPVGARAGSLPAPPVGFGGREAALRDFASLASGPTPTYGPRVFTVTGPAGVGKSALALVGAAAQAPRHGDGCVYLDFAVTDRLLDPADVIATCLVELGEDPRQLPSGRAALLARLRSRTAGRSHLFVLDNVGPLDPVAELLPNANQSLVVLTSRTPHPDLLGAPVLDLATLTPAETRALMAAGLGGEAEISRRTAGAREAEDAELAELADVTEGQPVAVRTCAQLLASHPGWTLRRLLDRLADVERRFDMFSPVDRGLGAVFAEGARNLSSVAGTVLAATGLLGLAQVEPWMVAAALDRDEGDVLDALDELTAARLIDDVAGTDPVFAVSSLLRTYAGRRWRERGAEESAAAVARYVALLAAALRARRGGDHAAVPSTVVDAIGGLPESSLVSAVELASRHGLIAECAELAQLLGATVFADRNSFEAWRHTHDHALGQVRAAGSSLAEAGLALSRARLHLARDQYDQAERKLAEAAALADSAGATDLLADVCVQQATLWAETHRSAQAIEVLAGWPSTAPDVDLRTQAEGLRQRAAARRDLGDLDGARGDADQAYALFVAAGDRNGEGLALRSRGLNHLAIGEVDAAYRLGLEAEDAFLSVGSRLLAQYAVQLTAKARFRAGGISDPSPALAAARDVCAELHDDFGQALMLRTSGEEALVLDDLPLARQHLEWSLKMWSELELPGWQARTLRDLAHCARREGQAEQARTAWRAALQIFDRLGLREATELRRSFR